ncbi:MarR family transcriptional regulator [Enterocloster clostridioformis]|uniref:MarR family winged helix-turn-helix transcriptional regulator n=1 Tax=Enterocloster clostridioformis TaxID=1531 RepID=UPI001F425B52|nr:MarR family transcriptional regulator [Enterocloster clostridioformis]MCF2702717.1 MarR family transcriptional regulator [Enterocloster clostridioformis]
MNFHYLLMSGHAIYLKQLMAQLNHTGLTPGQPKVLDYLMAHDGANQREIADACHIEAATLTSVLNGMEAKSLIERRRTDGDWRSFYIYLTDSGKEMGQKVTEAFSRLEEDTFRDIPPERVQEFMELFRELYLRMQRNFDTGEPAK